MSWYFITYLIGVAIIFLYFLLGNIWELRKHKKAKLSYDIIPMDLFELFILPIFSWVLILGACILLGIGVLQDKSWTKIPLYRIRWK